MAIDYALSNDIYIGSTSNPLFHFTNRSITLNSAQGVYACDVIGNQLSIDTFSFIIRYRYDTSLIYAPVGKDGYEDTNGKIYRLKTSGIPQYFPFIPSGSDALIDIRDRTFRVFAGYKAEGLFDVDYGTPVYWYISGSFFSKGYLRSVDRVGKYAWKFTCVSGIGLLDTKMHNGGLYTGQKLISVVRDIIGGVFSVVASSDAGSTPMYGHLPYDTARNNLHRILFAAGASLVKNNVNYDYTIKWLDGAEISVPASRISINGTVDYQLPSNTVEVTEHGFFKTAHDETVVLYDNTNSQAADNLTVVFDNSPIYSLGVTGTLTIVESSVNHAVVSGVGTLTGKPYTHTQQFVRMSNRKPNEPERIRRVTDNEMVNSVNSRNVASRVLGYYGSAKTVKSKLILNSEKTGSLISTVDAFGEETTGVLSKMTVTPTTVKGAQAEIISGYVPGDFGNNYSNRVEITSSGTWTVPAGVTTIRIILVGGGKGGQGGYDGIPGLAGVRSFPSYPNLPMDIATVQTDTDLDVKLYYATSTQPPQSGGKAGAGGTQGLVLAQDVTVNPGEVITLAPGTGGAGGAANGGEGSDGTPTTATSSSIGTLTSETGTDIGYYDPIAKVTYGTQGAKGYNGGAGGTSGSIDYTGWDGSDGVDGGSVSGYAGGAGGAGTGTNGQNFPAQTSHGTSSGMSTYLFFACGSGGGGAAYGNAGSPGGTFFITENWDGYNFHGFDINNALGGAGANAVAPAKASYGNGGRGGNGGGGGGNASGAYAQHAADGSRFPSSWVVNAAGQTGAPGGSGSVGGDGGDGAVIIYY